MTLDSVFYTESGQPLLTQAGFKIDNKNKRIIKKNQKNPRQKKKKKKKLTKGGFLGENMF